MSDVRFLHDELRKAWSDGPWHGPAVQDLLRDLTAVDAAARPIEEAHSIWELVLHLTVWQSEVRRRLGGAPPSVPEEGDWPEVREVTETAWQRDRERLGSSIAELLATLTGLGEQDLERTGGSIGNPETTTHRAMVNGVVQHLAYHGGQIALLRKALRAGAS